MLVALVIKRVQRVLPKLHAKRAIIRTLTVTYGTLQKNSVLNLPKQSQVCPSLFFQFNMRISVIYGTLKVSCKRVVDHGYAHIKLKKQRRTHLALFW